MKFDNKLIVSDIDGTFFDDNAMIADRNIDAVNYFKENGGLFTFATGRNEITIEPEIAKIANAPIICCNGAYIYDYETCRRHNEICIAPGPAISIINTVLESFPSVCAAITVGTNFYIIGSGGHEQLEKNMLNLSEIGVTFADSLDEVPSNQWYTVVFHGESSQLDLVQKYINVAGENSYRICRSWPTMLEVNNIRANKGKAACELKHLYDTKTNGIKLYGIGDYENDIELLQQADISACPQNAIKALHEIADVIVCSNNDGAVAGLIEYIDENV